MSYTTTPSSLYPLPSTITINYNNGDQLAAGTYTLKKDLTNLSTKIIKTTNSSYSYVAGRGTGWEGTSVTQTVAIDNNDKIYLPVRSVSRSETTGYYSHLNKVCIFNNITKSLISVVTVPFNSTGSLVQHRNDGKGNSYYSSNANMIYTPYASIYSTSSLIVCLSTIDYNMTSIALNFSATGVWGDNNGNLYITSYNSAIIVKYNISSATFTTIFSNASSIIIGYLITLVIGNDGFIYALNNSQQIYKISTNGSTCTLFVNATGFNNMTYDVLTGDIYGFTHYEIYKITPSGTKTLYLNNLEGVTNIASPIAASFYNINDNSIYWLRPNDPYGVTNVFNVVIPLKFLIYSSISTSIFSQGANTLQIYKDTTPYGIPIVLNTAITGTAPTITNITNESKRFNVFFTPGTGGNPDPITYFYSLNGGTTYTNANSTTSPIIIEGLDYVVNYSVTLIANNLGGNTAPSNVVIGFIPYPCFLQGSKILRMNPETDEEEYIAVEKLRRGDLIRTAEHGYKAIELIGQSTIPNPTAASKESRRLYWFRKSKCSAAGLFEDLCVTGDHCILHRTISDEKKDQIMEYMRDIYVTESHYRVPAFLDDRAEPYARDGPATIWHFALENPNIYHNYGVMANGLLVESCSLHYMYKHSNMRLI